MHFIGYIESVAFGLAIDVEKHGGFAIGGHHGIDRGRRKARYSRCPRDVWGDPPRWS